MPALEGLFDRIASDKDWLLAYEANLLHSNVVAKSTPLIHVTKSLKDIISIPPYVISPSAYRLKTDTQLGLNNYLHFYAGRSFPSFGGVALAFEPDIESRHTGLASPFDTAGFANGYIKSELPDPNRETLSRFIENSAFDLFNWRQSFAMFLAAYFPSPLDYWVGRPYRPDPEGIFMNPGNHWRAWTFEVIFRESHSVFDAVAWCASEAEMASFQGWLYSTNSPLSDELEGFLKRALVPQGTPYYSEVIEEWVIQNIKV